MTEVLVKLSPAPIDKCNLWPETPEEAIYQAYGVELRYCLTDMLVQPTFAASEVGERLQERAADVTPGIIAETMDGENRWYDDEDKPFHRHLGKMAIEPDTALELRPDRDFVDDIQRQLGSLPYSFGALESYHTKLAQTQYIALAQRVEDLSRSKEEDWADTAFSALEEAIEHREEYALGTEDSEALLLICYLQGYSRLLTRRLLVGNMILDTVEKEMGEMSDDEVAVFGALRQFLMTDVVVGSQWTDRDISETTQQKIARYTVQQAEALSVMERYLSQGRAKRVGDVWWEQTNLLATRIKSATETREVPFYWQSEDIGHCFNGFRDMDLVPVFRQEFYKDRKNPPSMLPEKLGKKAIILEDDSKQMELWQRTVDAFTRYDVSPELCSDSPEAFLEAAQADNVGLVFIDIQNGTDTHAGIRVAEELLRRELAVLADRPATEISEERKNIILWSSSGELVEAAGKYFREILDNAADNGQISYSLPSTGRGIGGATINFEVCRKEWDAFGFSRLK